MSLLAWIKGRGGPNGFGYASTAEEVTGGLDLSDKTMLVTGVSSGLGEETARVLGLRGARVVGLARTEAKAEGALADQQDAVPVACELTDPGSIRRAVDAVKALDVPLDAIICNAGIMALPEREVVHGQEKQFFTNHIGHFMLVTGLLDRLATEGRVVMLSSAAHAWAPPEGIRFSDLSFEQGYRPNTAYGQSKLANLLFARTLAKRFAADPETAQQTANAVHPGVIATNLGRHMNVAVRALMPLAGALALKTIPQGAATQCYVATHPDLAGVTGEYFADCNPAKTSRHGYDEAMGERLWEVSEAIVAEL